MFNITGLAMIKNVSEEFGHMISKSGLKIILQKIQGVFVIWDIWKSEYLS